MAHTVSLQELRDEATLLIRSCENNNAGQYIIMINEEPTIYSVFLYIFHTFITVKTDHKLTYTRQPK